ncbi:hypothetical protein BHK69_15260 [Bosea vaviloviae]|uniref:Uncharacterized protein n=1 Tax=Bosea vaviloviae TaxID=1526658 RepID=A0A1D7U2N8_9HYPH|nr:hypothetical protein BHK69_15260 [Bosea vaviloviae]
MAVVSIVGFSAAAASQANRPIDQAMRVSVLLIDQPVLAVVPSPSADRPAIAPSLTVTSTTALAARKVRVVLPSPFAR